MAKPKIRFKGYTDDWEQRKLGEVLDDMYNGQTPSRKRDEYWNGNIRWLSSGELNRGTVYSSIETITEEGKNSANLRVVPKGTFVMAITGLEASGTRGNCALLGFDTTLNQSCMALFPKQDILISQFLFQWYRMVGEEYGINYTQGTKQQSYNAELIKILPILLPSIDEQKKIASYLNSIDHLITLHQCKCHLLLKLLHNDWEQRKLGEVFKEYSEKGHTELPTLTIIQGGGTVKREDSDRNLMYDEANLSNYKMVRKDDFIVHLRSFEGGLEKSSLDGIISPAYHTFHSDEADSRFYYSYFRSFEFIKHKLVPHVYGIRDGRSIDIEGMKSIEIPYTSLSEQRKIGDCLEQLDHLITLHQCKCHLLLKLLHNDWEQRKFGDLGSVAMCKRIFKEQTSTDGDIPFYKIGTFGAEPDAFISRELFEEYRGKFQYPNIGDMLISASGTIGRTVEYKGEEAYFQDSNIVWFKHDDRVDNSFLKCIYEIVKWSGIEGSTIKRLYNDNFLKTEFSMPKVAEQQQIGMYFQSLDHLITLHQRKNIYF